MPNIIWLKRLSTFSFINCRHRISISSMNFSISHIYVSKYFTLLHRYNLEFMFFKCFQTFLRLLTSSSILNFFRKLHIKIISYFYISHKSTSYFWTPCSFDTSCDIKIVKNYFYNNFRQITYVISCCKSILIFS